jgi:nucleoside recognition membrane protein YjiH
MKKTIALGIVTFIAGAILQDKWDLVGKTKAKASDLVEKAKAEYTKRKNQVEEQISEAAESEAAE